MSRDRRPRSDASPYGSRLLGPADQSADRLRLRIQVLLTAILVVTNLVGAGLVFVIANVVMPAPEANHTTILSLAIGVPVYVVVAVVLGGTVGTASTRRTLRWALTDDTEPTERDRRRALRVPFWLTLIQLLLWIGATVLFTLLAVVQQPDRALTTGLTIGTASVIVSGFAYLLTEFTLRPVFARALAGLRPTDRPRGVGIRTRLGFFWVVGTGVPVLVLVLSGILALVGVTDRTRLAVGVIVVGGVVLVFGLWVTLLTARAVASPLRSVTEAMGDVERGRLDREVVVYDGTELGLLQAGFNHMVGELRERERLRDLFGRHVGREVAQLATASDLDEIELGGETRTVSVLFVDLTGSTTFAEEHSPTEVVEVLNRFFGVVVAEVDQRGGLVNKFMGDAVLAVFGAPVDLDAHATAALATAREVARRLADEVPEVGAGVGVATGEVVVGHIGAEERFEYTAIGDTVNSAARLTDLAKKVPGCVLAAAEAVRSATAEEAEHWCEHDEVVLRGRSEPTQLFALRDAQP